MNIICIGSHLTCEYEPQGQRQQWLHRVPVLY